MSVHRARRRSSPRRRPELSQHFLRRGALAASLVAGTSISRHDLVVEIGPGTGALTRELVGRCARLIGVEIDAELCADLRRELGSGAEVVHADFLAWTLPTRPYKVIGNLPYAGSTAIIRRLASAAPPPQDVWLVVQRGTAQRLAGAPFAPETALSLAFKPRWQIEIVRSLRRTDFDPPPSVDSAVLWLAHRPRPLVEPGAFRRWQRFARQALARGPRARRALRPWLTPRQLERLAHDVRLDLDAPTSAIRFDQWLALFRFVERR